MRIGLLLAVPLAWGCGTELVSDYALQISPKVPSNQLFLSEDPDLSLVIRDDTGFRETTFVGSAVSGTSISAGNMPPLSGATIGVVIEEPGGNRREVDYEKLIAYGEAGPVDLALGAESEAISFILPEFAGVGFLGSLTESRFGAAVAVTSSGSVYLFGGTTELVPISPKVKSDILKLESLDSGDWSFRKVGDMPDAAMLSDATVLTTSDGKELILVTGGRVDQRDWGPNSKMAFLLDPETDEIIWQDELGRETSSHDVVVMQNNRVVLMGGLSGDGETLSFSKYWGSLLLEGSGGSYSMSYSYGNADAVGIERFGVKGTAIAEDGALFCGGAFYDEVGSNTQVPTSACDRIDLSAEISTGPEMPTPLFQHAITTLDDGRVLVVGGVSASVESGGVGPAVANAWLLDGNTWTETGSLNTARAGHEAYTLPDGRVLVVGGSTQAGFHRTSALGERADCPEVWDPETGEFSEWGTCDDPGSGTFPSFSYHPDHGIFATSGYDAALSGGDTYGIIGSGPAF